MSLDPLAKRIIDGQLGGTHETLLREAEYIRDAWDLYVKELRNNKSLHLSAEPLRLTEYSARFARDVGRYDGARDVLHTVSGEQ